MKAITNQLKSFNGFVYTIIQNHRDQSLSRESYNYKKNKHRQKSKIRFNIFDSKFAKKYMRYRACHYGAIIVVIGHLW